MSLELNFGFLEEVSNILVKLNLVNCAFIILLLLRFLHDHHVFDILIMGNSTIAIVADSGSSHVHVEWSRIHINGRLVRFLQMASHYFLEMLPHFIIDSISFGHYLVHLLKPLVHLIIDFVSFSLLPRSQEVDHSFGVDSGINELSNCHLFFSSYLIFIVLINDFYLS